jgi:hypothetical protein
MQYVAKKSSTKPAAVQPRPILQNPSAPTPAVQRRQQAQRALQRFTVRPTTLQRQVAAPVLRAAELHRQETGQLTARQQAVRRQVTALASVLPDGAVETALQRQGHSAAPAPAVTEPRSPSDWVTVMRRRAEQAEGQRLDPKAYGQFTALQRQVAGQLTAAFRQDRQPAGARHAAFAGHLVTLQRHALSRPVAQVVLGSFPAGERLAVQRAVDELQAQDALQRRQDEQALTLHSLQRQLADLDEQATKPVTERIQALRGSGNPLPEAVRRHLEQGLNHDLTRVRIHDDAEADKLAKGLNAVAFTTGTDIYFRSGKFNPNTQSGLELLAHEVTHTVQQSRGRVGKGIDPDAGLEDEARTMGSKLARVMPTAKSLMPPDPHAPGVYTRAAALRRVQEGAAHHTLLSPLRALQRQTDLTVQRSFVGDNLSGLAGQIPGYTPLTMALGYDPVAGKVVRTNPDLLLDALGRFVPGPFKEMVKVVREQKLIGKAWAWFQGELSRLQLGKVVTDLKGALSGMPNVGKAKDILVKATNSVRQLVLGSARKLAEIALTAITAGLGPVGKQVMGSLAKAGDVITQVLKNPGGFAKNLMNALRQGFLGFVTRSATWMRQGLGDWLTGSANIQLPRNLNVEGVLMTALSIMDLTAMSLERRLIKELGPGSEKKIALLKQAGGALAQLGPGVGKAPEMKAVASRVGGEVIGGIRTEVTETLVKKGIQKVALMFSPAGAAVGAVMTAWSTIQTVIDKGKQIMGVITSALSSVREIAAGNVAGAAKFIEKTVGNALPIVFNFAANVLGLRNIGARIRSLVRGMRQKLGIDKVIDAVVARLKKIVGAGRQMAGQAVSSAKGLIRGIFGRKTFTAGKEQHSIWFDTKSGRPQLWVASTPREARVQLHYAHREATINVEKSGGSVSLTGMKYTKATIDHELDQGKGKIAAALDAVSGGNFAALKRPEKVDAYFRQMSKTHFNGIEQHFKILFGVADANQANRATLTPATYHFTCKANMDQPEYIRQVGFANAELKAMSIETFLKRRTQALTTNAQERSELGVQPSGRDYTEGTAMRLVRTTAKARLEKLIGITRDGTIQPTEQAELAQFTRLLNTSLKDLNTQRGELIRIPRSRQTAQEQAKLVSLGTIILKITTALDALDPTMTPSVSSRQIKRAAQEMIGSLALLHSLDQIGGGSGTVFPGSGLDAYGVARVNSSIGASWPSMAQKIEDHVRKDVSPSNYARVNMSPITLAVR